MKFRKRIRIFPGFTINVSKSGVSSTIGVPGASINFGKNGAYLNTGIPGTGLYDRQRMGGAQKKINPEINHFTPQVEPVDVDPYEWLKKLEEPTEIRSSDISGLTSVSQGIMKEIIEDVYDEKMLLKSELGSVQRQLKQAKSTYTWARVLIYGFFVNKFKEKIVSIKEYIEDLNQQIEKCFINIDVQFDEEFKKVYTDMLESFDELSKSKKIWDVTTTQRVDQFATRSAAANSITRADAKLNIAAMDIIRSEHSALHFENKNGGDIYIYPSFVMILEKTGKFAIIDIKDLNIYFSPQRFIETEGIPSDSKIIDYTWEKVNKNGQPDRRFKDNRQIPIVEYGSLSIYSNTGVNEEYMISSLEKTHLFAESYKRFQQSV